MKCRPWYVLSIGIILLMQGCERTSDPLNQFISDFLKERSIQVYKSEIQRTRVNFFPNSKTLIYSFWKKEVFNENGDLFLHLYLKDSTLLPTSRKKHGFINLSIKNEEIIAMDSLHFYIDKDISSYGDLNSFVTGQYIGTKRTWFAKHVIKSTPGKYGFSNTNDLSAASIGGKLDMDEKMRFINSLIGKDAFPVFNENNVLTVFFNKERLEAYLTANSNSDFFNYEYSLCFFKEKEESRTLKEVVLFDDDTSNPNERKNGVSAAKISIPKQAKRMVLLRKQTENPKMILSICLD